MRGQDPRLRRGEATKLPPGFPKCLGFFYFTPCPQRSVIWRVQHVPSSGHRVVLFRLKPEATAVPSPASPESPANPEPRFRLNPESRLRHSPPSPGSRIPSPESRSLNPDLDTLTSGPASDVPCHDSACGPPQRPERDGQRRPGHVRRHRRQAARAQDPAALQRSDPRRVCRLGGRLVRAVLALRSQARTVPRQPRALGRRARQGLAHRSHAAPARSDADRAWTRRRRSCSPAPAI